MRRFLVAFLLINVAAIYLANAKTVILIDNDTGVNFNVQRAEMRSSEDGDVINFCRMCKSYVDLFQQADDTVEVRMPLENLCDDVDENDQNLCLESIDNLHRLASFDDLSTVDNLEVCQLVSLCEEMSSSEEEQAANGSDSVEDVESNEIMESSEGIVETLLVNATHNHAHLLNGTHPGSHVVHPTYSHPHEPIHPKELHINHHHHPNHDAPPHKHDEHHHDNGHGHHHGHNHNHNHHSGATANAVLSSALLLFISIFISKNFKSM